MTQCFKNIKYKGQRLTQIQAQRIHPTLPVFQVRSPNRSVLYVPGYLMPGDPDVDHHMRTLWEDHPIDVPPKIQKKIQRLEMLAKRQIEKRRQWLEAPFRPICLTVYLSNDCNMRCAYCYVPRNRYDGNRVIQMDAFMAAAQLVAENCTAMNLPFTLVLHGGGEPTRHFNRVRACVANTRSPGERQLDVFLYGCPGGRGAPHDHR